MAIRRDDVDRGSVDLSAVIDRRRRKARPVHPGRILRLEFLQPLDITAYRLAKDINVPLTRIAEILAGRRGISADTALRLGRYFGTDAQSWLNLQARFDLEATQQANGKQIARDVKPRAA